MPYDVFISHASEDKTIAEPLAGHLTKMGYNVWYDASVLTVGDSLRRSIDRGLAESRYGIVVLSPNFFSKNWPQYELDALVARENANGEKIILPIWHKVSHDEVLGFSPTLADRIGIVSSLPLPDICEKLASVLGSKSVEVPSQIQDVAEICSQCGQGGEIFGFEGSDGDEFHWFECSHCGNFQEIR
jgi:hypothetical protein